MSVTTIDSREKLIAELGEMLDMANQNKWPYVDLTDQCVEVHVDRDYSDAEIEEGLEGHELVDIEPLSSREAFEVMEDFANSRLDDQCNRLFDALSRRHPFSTFRYAVEQLGILQDWYAYKNEAYEKIAEEKLDDYGVDFEDGKIVCKNKSNIYVFHLEDLGDADFA